MSDSRRPPAQEPDRIYADAQGAVDQFRFDEAVARVFPDMIRRSVPGYTTIIPMTGVIAARYAQAGSNLYDLGCSLGATTLAMRHAVSQPDCRIVAVDNSAAMIERCNHYIALDEGHVPVELKQSDILDLPIDDASVVTLNFTLQFVEPERRLELLTRICQGLRPGGALVLSEKIRFDDEREQAVQETLHHDFKRAHGYSDLEISQKRSALEQVLIPETLDAHRKRLGQAGFDTVVLWYQCFNFCSLLALKAD
ncbi:carboxy-S-adenosyl-L-methionine synthase CmoA [Marinobacteraceae bacterium S3BR75-40.1]